MFCFVKFKVLLITMYNAMLLWSAETDSAGSPHWIGWSPLSLGETDHLLAVTTGGHRELGDGQLGGRAWLGAGLVQVDQNVCGR